MSLSRRRGDLNTKLHMDRQPAVARITDPSLPAGKRREIDNVMKKARANNTNDYWDKKLLEAEEKDPNRWRHTGYKKMYIQGESSSGESDRETVNYNRYNSAASAPAGHRPISMNRYGRSRSRSGSHSTRNSRLETRRLSPSPTIVDATSSRDRRPRSPMNRANNNMRPRSPPEPVRRRMSRTSPVVPRRRSPPPPQRRASPPAAPANAVLKRAQILPRSKRPPSPPPRGACRSGSNSSVSSCSDDSCSVCSPKHHHRRSRSLSRSRIQGAPGPRSPPLKPSRAAAPQYRNGPPQQAPPARIHHSRPISPPPARPMEKYRGEGKSRRNSSREHSAGATSSDSHMKLPRSARHSSPPEDPRLKTRPPEPPEPHTSSSSSGAAVVVPPKKKKRDKEFRARIKVEGEKRKKRNSSSGSDDSAGSDSDSSLPRFTATTRLTLSERFGKMAQWSMDRSNMENMRITKDSAGGALKVMIEEGFESPPRRYSYSPAPVGHFPEELATTAPSGMLSWDDVRVRYDYYKSRGYLRDLDLKDYIRWEEWWYKYQQWLKKERYYEYWERQQMQRRQRRKKLPIAQRLN